MIHYGEEAKRVPVPDFAHLLPEPIQRFTTKGVYDLEGETHMSFIQGAGHGGSHPHLVNEFLSAIVEDRDPFPNAVQSANWTCTGICAHDSALRGGRDRAAARVDVGVTANARAMPKGARSSRPRRQGRD